MMNVMDYADQNGELDPELVEYCEERDRIQREIADRENDVTALRLDLANYGGGVKSLKKIARSEARIESLREELEELDHAWVSYHAFEFVVM